MSFGANIFFGQKSKTPRFVEENGFFQFIVKVNIEKNNSLKYYFILDKKIHISF